MMDRKSWLVALLVVAACGGDSTGPGNDEPELPDYPVSFAATDAGVVSDRYTAEVATYGDYVYTSTWGTRVSVPGNTIKIWNVRNGVTLVDSLRIAEAGTIGDVQVSPDGKLLMAAVEYNPNGMIVLYSLANPAKPVEVSRFASVNTRAGVHTAKFGVVGGKLYAFLSIDPAGSPARLTIVDLGTPAAPKEVWSQAMGQPYVHDVFVRDGLLFTALWDQGLKIWDLGGGGRGGSPSAPVAISTILPVSGNIHNVWWFHDEDTGSKRYVFLGEEGPGSVNGGSASGDIHVIDISNLNAPRQVAIYTVAGAGTHNFWGDEENGYLYAAYYNGGVRALDVRGDLENCPAEQKETHGLCDLRLMDREAGFGLETDHYIWGVVQRGTDIFASDMRKGLVRLDVSALRR